MTIEYERNKTSRIENHIFPAYFFERMNKTMKMKRKMKTDHIRAVGRGNDLLWSRIPFDCLCCGDRSKGKEAPGI